MNSYHPPTPPSEPSPLLQCCFDPGHCCNNVECNTPVAIRPKVKATYPQVTPKQVHTAWTQMSEMPWKRDKVQIPSAKHLLEKLGNEGNLFDIKPPDGVKQVAWWIKPILRKWFLRSELMQNVST